MEVSQAALEAVLLMLSVAALIGSGLASFSTVPELGRAVPPNVASFCSSFSTHTMLVAANAHQHLQTNHAALLDTKMKSGAHHPQHGVGGPCAVACEGGAATNGGGCPAVTAEQRACGFLDERGELAGGFVVGQ